MMAYLFNKLAACDAYIQKTTKTWLWKFN